MKTNSTYMLQRLLILASVIALIFSADAYAQRGRTATTRSKKTTPKVTTPAKETVNWHVSYTVTIKGRGEVKGVMQGEPDIKWSVDRSFVGRMRLDGPTPRRENGKVVPGWVTFENYGSKARPWTVNVKINDRIEKFYEGPGEIGTHENKNEVTVWEGGPALIGPAEDLSALGVNPTTGTYFVVFPVVPKSIEKNIRMSRFAVIDRSPVGYGGKPTNEVTKPIEDMIAIDDIPTPRGEYLMPFRKGSAVIFPASGAGHEPLPPTYPYTVELRRTCFKPREPFFEGIEETKTQVDVCVEFLLSKVPH
jgi:hypothetical protein